MSIFLVVFGLILALTFRHYLLEFGQESSIVSFAGPLCYSFCGIYQPDFKVDVEPFFFLSSCWFVPVSLLIPDRRLDPFALHLIKMVGSMNS